MNEIRIEPQWIVTAAALVLLGSGGYAAYGAFQRRSRRRALLARLERIGYRPRIRCWSPMAWADSSTSTTCC